MRPHPPKECGCLHGGIIESGRTRNPLTLRTVPVLVHIRVWVHILGDPQLRKATTTSTSTTTAAPPTTTTTSAAAPPLPPPPPPTPPPPPPPPTTTMRPPV